MAFTRKELNRLALCLGRCDTCSELSTCRLKEKVREVDDQELDGIVYDALAGYYHKLYGLDS